MIKVFRVFFAWLLEQTRTALRRLFRRAPKRTTDPVFVAGEVGAILTQLALNNIGKTRLTVEDCMAAVKADRRTCEPAYVVQHLRAMARSVKPLRAVVPLECITDVVFDNPDRRWTVGGRPVP